MPDFAISSEFSFPLTPGMADHSTGERSVALALAQAAVNRARIAQPAWRALGLAKRARVIERFRQLVFEERHCIAETVRDESGKPLPESLVADVTMTLEGARYLSRSAARVLAPRKLRSQTLAAWRKTITTSYAPFGVVAVISPWNYPFFFPAMHAITALIAGNAVVLKPSEHTPACADHIARLLHAAGVPPDVFSVLHGDGTAGAALVSSSIDKVFFTGSERTGREIAVTCAPRFVPVSLELGGSDAAVVLPDADFANTASGILWGRFANAGQTCVAVKRVVAIDSAYDALLPLLARGISGLRIGAHEAHSAHHLVDAVDVGPMITEAQRTLIAEQVNDAMARGATVAAQQTVADSPTRSGRLAPAIMLTNVTPDMRVWHEETFGPVLVMVRASSESEAIEMANSTRYGLSATVWSTNRARAVQLAAQLDGGAVAINDVLITAGLPEIPHGGVKASGLGRIHGVEGLLECVRTHTVVDDVFPGARQPWWFGYGPALAGRLDAYLRLTHGRSWIERLSGLPDTIRLLLRPERPL